MPAAWAADTYSWTVLCEMEQLRAIWCWLSPREWSRRTSFNLRMVSLFCGNWESPLTSGVQSPRLPYAAVPIRCRSPFRTTTVKPIGFSSEHRSASLRNGDLHQFGTLIAIPRNPQARHRGARKSELRGVADHQNSPYVSRDRTSDVLERNRLQIGRA